MKTSAPPLVALAILLYCAWNAAELLTSWQGTTPLTRLSWLAFLIWIAPIVLYWLPGSLLGAAQSPCNPVLLALALLCSLLGVIGSLNTLQYYGLALALAGIMPWSWGMLIWILCAVSWMPALTWLGSHVFPSYILVLRLALASLSVFLLIFTMRKQKEIS